MNSAWVYLVAPGGFGNPLAPGQSRHFSLQASPPPGATNLIENAVIIAGADGLPPTHSAVTVQVTEQLTGALEFEVTAGDGATPLAGASVRLVQQAVTTQVVGSKVITYNRQFSLRTDSNGLAAFASLPVGLYNYDISRPGYEGESGVAQVVPNDNLQASVTGGHSGLAHPFESPFLQQNGRIVVSLAEAPFRYDWNIIRATGSYTIELLITQNNDAEGISLFAPLRNWRFATCDTDQLLDTIPVLNPTASAITLTGVSLSVPDVAAETLSWTEVVPANGQGTIVVSATKQSQTVGQGTIHLSGIYTGTDDDLVAYTFNPGSFTEPFLQSGQPYQKGYVLTPTLYQAGVRYDVSITQPEMMEQWISLSSSAGAVGGGESIRITATITPPTWLQDGHTYVYSAAIGLSNPADGKSRSGILRLEVTPNGQDVALHTVFEPGPTPISQYPMDAAGPINARIIECSSGSGEESGGDGGGWTWDSLPGGGHRGHRSDAGRGGLRLTGDKIMDYGQKRTDNHCFSASRTHLLPFALRSLARQLHTKSWSAVGRAFQPVHIVAGWKACPTCSGSCLT